MSRSSYQRGFVPSYSYSLAPTINSFTIPRSYNHSSDESEAGSPSGGGGGSHGFMPTGHGVALNPNYHTQPQLEDTPFNPRSATQHTSTRGPRELTFPPDSHQNEYNYGQASAPTDAHSFRNARHGHRHHGNPSNGGPQYDQGLRHTPPEGGQWGSPLGQEGYYRLQTSMNPNYNLTGGVSDSYQHVLTQPQGGPQSYPRSGPPSGHGSQSPESPPDSLNPGSLDNPYEDAGDYLRAQLGIPPGHPVNLHALPDPPNGSRPTHALAILMKLAIYGSPNQKLTLREIYTALENRFEYFRKNKDDQAWKNSIRHHLSLNKVFRNIQRPITEPGKGKYWVLDVSQGEGYKRERKRRTKTKAGSTGSEEDPVFLDEPEDFSEDDRSGSGSPGPSTSRQERARRTRGTTPYPPAPAPVHPGSTMVNLSQMSIADLQPNMGSYSTMTSPPTQPTHPYGQSAHFAYPPAAAESTHAHPGFAQPSTHAAMNMGGYGYPGAHQQVFRGPQRQSPTEQNPGYHEGGFMDPRGAAPGYEGHYGHGQYGPPGSMRRGNFDKGKDRDRN